MSKQSSCNNNGGCGCVGKKGIPLFAIDMDKPEIAKAVEKATKERNNADYQCYLLLQQYEEALYAGLYQAAENGQMELTDAEDAASEIRNVIQCRIKANDRLISLLSGHEREGN